MTYLYRYILASAENEELLILLYSVLIFPARRHPGSIGHLYEIHSHVNVGLFNPLSLNTYDLERPLTIDNNYQHAAVRPNVKTLRQARSKAACN